MNNELSGYTGMKKETSASSQKEEQASPSACSLIRSCADISVRKFMKAYCNNDLSVLIITGHPTTEELESAWYDVMYDYSSRIRTDESNYVLHTAWRIGQLQAHIIYVDNALLYLRVRYNEDMVNELRQMGYTHLLYKEHNEDWQQQLRRVESKCKTKVYDLELLVEEYNKLNKISNGTVMKEDDFNANVAMLAKYQGYPIHRDMTMMDEYLSIFNNYMKELQRQKNNQ